MASSALKKDIAQASESIAIFTKGGLCSADDTKRQLFVCCVCVCTTYAYSVIVPAILPKQHKAAAKGWAVH